MTQIGQSSGGSRRLNSAFRQEAGQVMYNKDQVRHVVVGRCECGGYGLVYGPEAQKIIGRCHDVISTAARRKVARLALDEMKEADGESS